MILILFKLSDARQHAIVQKLRRSTRGPCRWLHESDRTCVYDRHMCELKWLWKRFSNFLKCSTHSLSDHLFVQPKWIFDVKICSHLKFFFVDVLPTMFCECAYVHFMHQVFNLIDEVYRPTVMMLMMIMMMTAPRRDEFFYVKELNVLISYSI